MIRIKRSISQEETDKRILRRRFLYSHYMKKEVCEEVNATRGAEIIRNMPDLFSLRGRGKHTHRSKNAQIIFSTNVKNLEEEASTAERAEKAN